MWMVLSCLAGRSTIGTSATGVFGTRMGPCEAYLPACSSSSVMGRLSVRATWFGLSRGRFSS